MIIMISCGIIIIIIIMIGIILLGGGEGNSTCHQPPIRVGTVEEKETMEMDRARGQNNTIIIFKMRGRERFNINNERGTIKEYIEEERMTRGVLFKITNLYKTKPAALLNA